MKSHTPTEEEKDWMDDICDLGCIVCRVHLNTYTPACPHHMEGKSKKGSHLLTIPLCALHHQTGGHGIAFHETGKKTWEAKYGTQKELRDKTEQLILEKQNGVIFY